MGIELGSNTMKTFHAGLILACILTLGINPLIQAQDVAIISNSNSSLQETVYSPAQSQLSYLANQRKILRYVYGGFCTYVGVSLLTAYSPREWLDSDISTSTRIAMGAIGLIGTGKGISMLLRPSRAEQALTRISNIEDVSERERVGRNLLHTFADSLKRKRVMLGLGFLGIAAYHLIAKPYEDSETQSSNFDQQSALANSVFGMSMLIFKSPEERAYQRYLVETGKDNGPSINLAINPLSRHQFFIYVSF